MQRQRLNGTHWVNLGNGIRVKLRRFSNGWGCCGWEGHTPHNGGASLQRLREPLGRDRSHRFATPNDAVRFFAILFDTFKGVGAE